MWGAVRSCWRRQARTTTRGSPPTATSAVHPCEHGWGRGTEALTLPFAQARGFSGDAGGAPLRSRLKAVSPPTGLRQGVLRSRRELLRCPVEEGNACYRAAMDQVSYCSVGLRMGQRFSRAERLEQLAQTLWAIVRQGGCCRWSAHPPSEPDGSYLPSMAAECPAGSMPSTETGRRPRPWLLWRSWRSILIPVAHSVRGRLGVALWGKGQLHLDGGSGARR